MCHRIRRQDWQILRVDAEMTIHDAAMTRFSQWWQRNRRSGYATAEAFALRGQGDARLRREVTSNVLWALPPMWLLWPLLWSRIFMRSGALAATFLTLGKLPHCQGQMQYWWSTYRSRINRREARLIEYK